MRITIFLLFFPFFLGAQHLSQVEVPTQNIRLEKNTTPEATLESHPYATLSIYVRNFDKLNDREFRKRFQELASFILNANIKTSLLGTNEISIPVYVIRFEKNTTTQLSNQGGILIHKLLIDKNSATLPFAGCQIKSTSKSKMTLYNDILTQVSGLLTNVTTLNAFAAGQNVLSVFSDLTKKMPEANEINQLEWNFPILNTDNLVQPYEARLFLLGAPDSKDINKHFTVKNNTAYVGQNTPYTGQPYILVLTSLSDYLSEVGLPSKGNAARMGESELTDAENKLKAQQKYLSEAQFQAENRLLSYFKGYLFFKKSIEAMLVDKKNEQLKTDAFDAYYAFKKLPPLETPFKEHPILKAKMTEINAEVQALALNIGNLQMLNEVISLYIQDNNHKLQDKLLQYQYFSAYSKVRPQMTASNIYNDVQSRIGGIEAQLFEQDYRLELASLNTILKNGILSNPEKMKEGKGYYDSLLKKLNDPNIRCNYCRDSTLSVVLMYQGLEKNETSLIVTRLTQQTNEVAQFLQTLLTTTKQELLSPSLSPDQQTRLTQSQTQLEQQLNTLSNKRNALIAASNPLQKIAFDVAKTELEKVLVSGL